MENAALLSSKIEETKENNEFTHKIGQQYHKPQNTVKRGNFGRFFNIFLSISSILYNKRFFFRMYKKKKKKKTLWPLFMDGVQLPQG